MKEIYVTDMHCEKCVERINNAFKSENVDVEVNLKDKTVKVKEKDFKIALDLLEDLGFTV